MNNKQILNNYSEDLLSAKRLPLPLREFIITYGGVEKLRRDVWGRNYGEELVRQKEKGKSQERAERAANRHCQGILLEMAWKAGYIEERKPSERKVEKEKKTVKENLTEKVADCRTTVEVAVEVSAENGVLIADKNINRQNPMSSTVAKDNAKYEENEEAERGNGNRPILNNYSEDLLSAKRLPLPLREFIISYGGVEKLRRDVWGRNYGEELVRQKEKGKLQERAERAANRHCQGILLEMAWKAGYIEERKPSERKTVQRKAVTQANLTEKVKESRTIVKAATEASTEHSIIAINDKVNGERPVQCTVTKDDSKHEEKSQVKPKDEDDIKPVTVVLKDDTKQGEAAGADAEHVTRSYIANTDTVSGLAAATEPSSLAEEMTNYSSLASAMPQLKGFEPETTMGPFPALPTTTMFYFSSQAEFNTACWNMGRKSETHVLTFFTPEAAVRLFQRLAVSSSERTLSCVKSMDKISPTSVTTLLVQLPLLVFVPSHELALTVRTNTCSKENRRTIGPLPLLLKRKSSMDMCSQAAHSLSVSSAVKISTQIDKEENDDSDTRDGTAPETFASRKEKEKKSLRGRIGQGLRKFFRRLCVCGRKKAED